MTKKRVSPKRSAKKRPKRKGRRVEARRRWHEAVIVEYAQLLAWPNVERVGLGWKERRGALTARMAVKIFVREKKEMLTAEPSLPRFAHVLVPVGKGLFRRRKIPTDVVWHAPAGFIAAPGDFLNPVVGGAMVGVPGRQFGTFACVVQNAQGQTFGLTAGHVVQALQGRIVPNLQILQPPIPGSPLPPGATRLFGPTIDGFFGNTPAGFLDFALVRVSPQRAATTEELDGMPVDRRIMPSAIIINNRIPCAKIGAVTGRTLGAFSTQVPSIVIDGMAVTNVLEFKGATGKLFASAGDSGALVVSAQSGLPHVVMGVLIAATPPTPDAPAGRGFIVPFERIPGLKPF